MCYVCKTVRAVMSNSRAVVVNGNEKGTRGMLADRDLEDNPVSCVLEPAPIGAIIRNFASLLLNGISLLAACWES